MPPENGPPENGPPENGPPEKSRPEKSRPDDTRTRPKSRRWIVIIFVLAVAGGAAFLAASGIAERQQSLARLQETAAERSVPTVSVGQPLPASGSANLQLPGRLEANARAALFARVSGYIARWNSDIGAIVKAGDVLAEIEAPDLDQQLFQAQSDLVTAQTNAQLAEITNQRYQALLPNNTVSRQTADEKLSDVSAKRAIVKSAQANVARLAALAEYKKVVAPFGGVVTARNTDVGALINAGSTAGSELFVVSDVAKLRLYINVPQNYVPAVKVGTTAKVVVPERGNKFYAGKVESTSGAVDIGSGSMRVQLTIDNASGELIPGAYASVNLAIAGNGANLSVPASAIIFDKSGLRVATVGADSRVVLKKVTVARDLGSSVEVSSGLAREDRVIQNPPDDLVDGDRVAIKAPTGKEPTGKEPTGKEPTGKESPGKDPPASADLKKPDTKG